MKQLFFAACAFALAGPLTAPRAVAADLPIDVPVYVERPAAIGLLNWTGFYLGANLGYARTTGSMDIATANGALLSLSENMNGPFGGLHAGGNWQTGNGVFGIEADIQGISHSVSSTATIVDFAGSIVPPGATVTATNADKVTSFGTLRGRIGVATGRWLFYGTGGWSYWTWRSNLTVQGLGSVSLSEFQGGGAIGGGVELAVAPNWTARAEYLYLQSTSFSERPFLSRPDVVVNSRIRDNTFRVGVSYMFFTGSVGCRPHVC